MTDIPYAPAIAALGLLAALVLVLEGADPRTPPPADAGTTDNDIPEDP